ncbi:hypothetical protein EP331_04615 [bacterium]|nr:MAG: hypothetical protein EP331_04615 [bacterium]
MIDFIGNAGLVLLLAAWVPQTWDTVKRGSTPITLGFILLYMVSSFLLTVYSVMRDDTVFTILNGVLTFGSAINLFYKISPRKK